MKKDNFKKNIKYYRKTPLSEIKHCFNTEFGVKEIIREEIICYRASSDIKYPCIFYMKNGEFIRVTETFDFVDSVFDL